jgi:hypothetical protein
MNIKPFQKIITNVELLRQSWTVSKAELEPTYILKIYDLTLYHCTILNFVSNGLIV